LAKPLNSIWKTGKRNTASVPAEKLMVNIEAGQNMSAEELCLTRLSGADEVKA
jgi:hypothetical protein